MNIQIVDNITYQYDVQTAHVLVPSKDQFTIITKISDKQYQNLLDNKTLKEVNGLPYNKGTFVSVGDPFLNNDGKNVVGMISDRLLPDKIYTIPYKYNNKDRTFNLYYNGLKYLSKWSECDKIAHYKYCVSLLGNPKLVLIFKLSKDNYLASDYYKQLKHEEHERNSRR